MSKMESFKRKSTLVIQRDNAKQKKLVNHTASRRQNVTNTTAKPLSTDNRYADLSDIDEAVVETPTPTKIKVPPVVVINANYSSITTLMKSMNMQNYSLKYISMGIKILTNTLNDYNAVIRGLKEAKIEFYSHDVPSQQHMKFVVSGLPELTVDEVKFGLQEAAIQFVDVKKMRTKGDNKNYALYLVYFANKSTKLSELKACKYLLNVVVSWSPYIASRKGPTQCNNCQLHGHGSKNCNLPPRCSKCGGKHASADCQRDHLPLPERPYMCCLCGNAHSSRDRNCPKRIDYMKMKLSRATSKSNHPNKGNNAFDQRSNQQSLHQQRFISNDSEFPAMKVQPGRKFSDWFSPSQPSCPTNEVNTSVTEELFSPSQLLDITTELITNLRACRTKMDQFQVITRLAIKYVNYD